MKMPNLHGKSVDVCPEVTKQWKSQLLVISEQPQLEDIYNCDKTGTFFSVIP